MYGLEKLLRTRIDGEFNVVPLPDKSTEGALYTSYNEPNGVPKPIADLVAFCDQHNIQIDIHRKPVTCGCIEAIQARSLAYGLNIQVYRELKTVVLKTMENIKIAFYMCGDQELPKMVSPRGRRYGIDCSLLSAKTGFTVLGFDDDPQLVTGRLNPVTLFLDFGEQVEHFFDISDFALNGPMYTNGGCNTWGIRIDNVSRMLTEVGAQRLKGVCCPISSGTRSIARHEEGIASPTFSYKVA